MSAWLRTNLASYTKLHDSCSQTFQFVWLSLKNVSNELRMNRYETAFQSEHLKRKTSFDRFQLTGK